MATRHIPKVTCDGCGAEQVQPGGWESFMISPPGIYAPGKSPRHEIDLCGECRMMPVHELLSKVYEMEAPCRL